MIFVYGMLCWVLLKALRQQLTVAMDVVHSYRLEKQKTISLLHTVST